MIKLELTQSQFEKLHERADSKAKAVKVDVQALQALLRDHSTALAGLRTHGIKHTEPQEPEPTKAKYKLRIKGKS